MQDKMVVNFIVAGPRPCTAAEMTGQGGLGQRFETNGLKVRRGCQIYSENSGTHLPSYVSYDIASYSQSRVISLVIVEATHLDLNFLQATIGSQSDVISGTASHSHAVESERSNMG